MSETVGATASAPYSAGSVSRYIAAGERLAMDSRRHRRRPGAARRTRPRPATPRPPPRLPRARADAVHAREDRPRAASVLVLLGQTGAAVRPHRAQLDLRVREADAEHLRLRQRERPRTLLQLPRDPPRAVPAPGAVARQAGRAAEVRDAEREGPRRAPRPPSRVPAGVGGERVGDELRRAVGAGGGGLEPRREARRVHAEHRRGRPL